MGKSRKDMVMDALQMAWPSVLESFFVALAGLIDTMMVATLGSYAVAAVGLTGQPKFIGLPPFIVDEPERLEPKLLDIVRYVVYLRDKQRCGLLRNHLAGMGEPIHDEADALIDGRLLQQYGDRRLVERATPLREHPP